MAITSIDGVVAALASGRTYRFDKASVANTTAGLAVSLWKSASFPLAGATPTSAALLDKSSTGSINWDNPTGGNKTYLGRFSAIPSSAGTALALVDRLGHMGGLSGTSASPQTVNLSVATGGTNLSARKGAADYTDVQWYLEWYADTGATGVNATVTFTDGAGTPSQTVTVAVPGTTRLGRVIPFYSAAGIQSVQSVQLSASTLTAGNFGVTATRTISTFNLGTGNVFSQSDWQLTGLPTVEDSACLTFIAWPSTTSTGTIAGAFKLIQG